MLDGEDETTVVDEVEDQIDDQAEVGDTPDESTDDQPAPQDDDEDVVSFGDVEARSEDEPEHIRDLRRRYREEKRAREELEARLTPKTDTKPRPKLDDYWGEADPEAAFADAMAAWSEDQAKAKRAEDAQREKAERVQRAFEQDVQTRDEQRRGLQVRDYDAAEDRVKATLDDTQLALLARAPGNKAALVYALGKNPDKLDELGKLKDDPVAFIYAAAGMAREVKVGRKPATQPEGRVSGSGAISGASAKTRLEQLEREADRTGDRTKLIAYRRQMSGAK